MKGKGKPKAMSGSKDCFKNGGAVGMKSGGKASMPHKVHGASAGARLDKKGRGKVATPTNPLSGAAPKNMRSKTGENN